MEWNFSNDILEGRRGDEEEEDDDGTLGEEVVETCVDANVDAFVVCVLWLEEEEASVWVDA